MGFWTALLYHVIHFGGNGRFSDAKMGLVRNGEKQFWLTGTTVQKYSGMNLCEGINATQEHTPPYVLGLSAKST